MGKKSKGRLGPNGSRWAGFAGPGAIARVALSDSKGYNDRMTTLPRSGEFSADVREAFAYCERMARSHYENFPVASRFVPARRRPYIWSVYAFARTADDFADEGALSDAERLSKLEEWQRQLDACFEGHAEHPVFIALAETAVRTGIGREPLADLLTAFRMDVTTSRYATFQDLLGYCRCSANPVGRLVLAIVGDATPRKIALSDSICTALQLTNFWQDVAIDRSKGRIYVPLEDLARFGYTEAEFGTGAVDDRFRALMGFEVERTRALFDEGSPLASEVTPEIRFEIRLTLNGGRAILREIEKRGFDVLARRPTLSLGNKLGLLFRTMVNRTV
jgi:squalene synthase HpnC